jgi:DNA topoisomerase I
MGNVVIVESPAKAKTINKYLGAGYEVVASYGHVRDLPAKDGSVDPNADFAMLWDVDPKASKRVSDIAKMVKGADKLILATDPDREGEAISWHLLEILKGRKVLKDVDVERVTFNAITKEAVVAAMKAPRQIDQALVDAYLARRALDYLVGFSLSPVLWRKLPGARSAGRVQSVALRLVCDREMEIERFVAQEYWSVVASLLSPKNEPFEARLVGADGRKLNRLDVKSEADAKALKTALDQGTYRVVSVESKPVRRNPAPPFTTSTLQQEASRKLGLAPAITMRIAQKLYEGVDVPGEGTVGLITYMRTDGVQMAGEAIGAVRRYIGSSYSEKYLPGTPRAYSTKAKNAQEAHEAIRPTDVFRVPAKLRGSLSGDDLALYELIWKRTVASQMESAELERTAAEIEAKGGGRVIDLRATGQVIRFDGFLALYNEGRDDDEDEENKRLPALQNNDPLTKRDVTIAQHFTEPPPRYSEASLIKRMEELGIGRPSTYASTMAVLRDREYVKIEKKRLVAEDKGRLVIAFLESFFARYVEFDFTANLENDLDRISNSEIDWKAVLSAFWKDFDAAILGTKELRTSQVLDSLNTLLEPHIFPKKADGGDARLCPRCGSGQLSLKLGKLGPFIGCSNYPECRYTRPLSVPANGEDATAAGDQADGVKVLGIDPDTKQEVTMRDGRFGPYVQLGGGDKPKRSSLPKGMKTDEVDLAKALSLLSLPRTVGSHPETGEPILASIGRYGPYLQMGKTFANLDGADDVLTVGLNRAVDLIATKLAKGPGRFQRGGAPAGTSLGDHPDGGAVTLRDGRYGAYVNWGTVNATLPNGMDKTLVTLDQAIALIRAKQAAGPTERPARFGKKTSAKAAPKAKTDSDEGKAVKKAPAKAKPGKTKGKV